MFRLPLIKLSARLSCICRAAAARGLFAHAGGCP